MNNNSHPSSKSPNYPRNFIHISKFWESYMRLEVQGLHQLKLRFEVRARTSGQVDFGDGEMSCYTEYTDRQIGWYQDR